MKRRFTTAAARSERFQTLFDALRASENMDVVAEYLARGRILSSARTKTLEARWRVLLRKYLDGGSFEEAMEDVFSELTLRGIDHVELPRDLEALVISHYERVDEELKSNFELRMALFEKIFKFAETLRKPNN
ncbi:MAG: hypothetical protein Q7T45_14415 [Bradyrhizobium sp.]|uniref:hypothetical protein n=1 Tax=Bradyrhizobium sp. TaxID=376 RepID=UPI002720F6CB|nr:hypothetical protein [Bradyrhizobium sp.]MDO8399007.1 hypothetical protein [Bradyrhizobium sp.]